jgi:tRNA-specific 2-thiouridylase
MSGGVDSSVTALLLMEAGYEVFGITMEHIAGPARSAEQERSGGPQASAAEEAAAVCRHLGIRHETIDLRREFSDTVIEDFVGEYLAGRTPNPCVLCNRTIKWGALFEQARRLGAQYFATGHYARIHHDPHSGRFVLAKAAFRQKDQSYALWRLSQPQLAHTLFPLGTWTKCDVRVLAETRRLPVAHRPESQEICFIHDDNYQRFITEHFIQKGIQIGEGDIVTAAGEKIGRHRGYPYYTIGQRKGLGIAVGHPVFVTAIDAAANRLVVDEKNQLMSAGLAADQANWIAEALPDRGTPVEARIRYKDPGYLALLQEVSAEGFTLRFREPRPAVTPGQSAVLYRDEIVLGGGIITRALPI